MEQESYAAERSGASWPRRLARCAFPWHRGKNIEGKLKKMIALAVEMQSAKRAPPAASQAPGGGN
jgi:hypothetical protein